MSDILDGMYPEDVDLLEIECPFMTMIVRRVAREKKMSFAR